VRAVTWCDKERVEVVEVEKPAIQDPKDAILKVTSSAICGSDLHIYAGTAAGLYPGMVLGHEFVGVVEEVGPGVVNVRPGERYVASMATACGSCQHCFAGNHTRCRHHAFFGSGRLMGDLPGGQAEYVRVPFADVTLSRVPDGMADEDVIFIGDILATAYSACVAGGLSHGESVAVVGAGPVGQLVIQCAQLFAPSAIFAIDLVPERLEQAAAAGATPIDLRAGDPAAEIKKHNDGAKVDLVVEAVGSEASLKTAWDLPRVGGRIAGIGLLRDEPFPVSAGKTFLKGLSYIPVVGQPLRYRDVLTRLVRAKRLEPARVISERVGIEEAPEAYARMYRRETTKVVLSVAGS